MIAAVVVSLSAAACFGVSCALQHTAVGQAQQRTALRPGLLAEAAQRPGWILGALLQLTGVVLHLYAINVAALSIVQPLLTVGLVIALEFQRLKGCPVPGSARLASALVVIGLVAFLTRSSTPASTVAAGQEVTKTTGPGLAVELVLVTVLVGALSVGLHGRSRARPVAFGTAAGTLMATSAAMSKEWGTILRTQGWPELLASRPLWAGMALGLAGFLVSQTAFQAGPLAAPLAAMMAVDPVVSVVLGVVVFGEPLDTGVGMLRQAAGLVIVVLGVVLLARAQGQLVDDCPQEDVPIRWHR